MSASSASSSSALKGLSRPQAGLVCSSPMIGNGLRFTIESAGFDVIDLDPTSRADSAEVAVILLRASKGAQEIRDFRKVNPEIAIIALSDYDDPDLSADVISAGATSVIPWDCDSDVLAASIYLARAGVAAIEGRTLAWLISNGTGTVGITEAERVWLGHLERGITVSQLAPIAGYSERSLYRQLSQLYHRLGSTDRQGAISEARRRSLL